MRQLLQHLGDGKTEIVDVPAPGPSRGALLIRTSRSLISAGTERRIVDFGKAGWIGKARQQPEKVRAVLNKIRANGVLETWRAVRSKLAQPIPLGYCQVGRVIAVGDDSSWLSVDCSRGKSGSQSLDGASQGGAAGFQPLGEGSQGGSSGQKPITMNQELLTDAFRIGDRVISNGPHAEMVSASHNLCAKIPEGVSDDAATFTPLAAIALEGIHLLAVNPGDKVGVTGLGLIGQLAVRILCAKGCEVLGFDPSPERRALAEKFGAQTAVGDTVAAAMTWSKGAGVAGVLITASTASNDVVNLAARSCRHRGRVVLVGVVGLRLNRADFYRNEVSFQVSCSYGTRDGRGDQCARRNFEQVLAWMAAGQLPVEDLITHRFEFDDAPRAYEALADRSALGILMTYGSLSADRAGLSMERSSSLILADPEGEDKGRSAFQNPGRDAFARTVELRGPDSLTVSPRVAFIGAGNFAVRTLLPALARLDSPPGLQTVASSLGLSARLLADKFGVARATTDVESILADRVVDAVFIMTRHNDHAHQAVAALRAGKHVWVEKPLCLSLDELRQIEAVLGSQLSDRGSQKQPSQGRVTENNEQRTPSASPTLMVGFNRRFAPAAVALREALGRRPGNYQFTMTVNAGRLDPDHWTLDPQVGGGRIVGEACHFVDLMRFLAGAPIVQARCVRRETDGQDGGAFELAFANSCNGAIDFRTDLPPHHPKETIKVAGEGGVSAEIHNWARLRTNGLGGANWGAPWSRAPRKGHREALQAFFAGITSGVPPMPLDEVLEVSRWSIAMQGMKEQATLHLDDLPSHE